MAHEDTPLDKNKFAFYTKNFSELSSTCFYARNSHFGTENITSDINFDLTRLALKKSFYFLLERLLLDSNVKVDIYNKLKTFSNKNFLTTTKMSHQIQQTEHVNSEDVICKCKCM